jgi:hypothetical protein
MEDDLPILRLGVQCGKLISIDVSNTMQKLAAANGQ